MHLLADSSSAFSINGFSGLTGNQIFSFWMVFVLFNGYVVLEVIALACFYLAARPRARAVNAAALWYFVAAILVVMAFISTVWAAPAEKSFLSDTGDSLGVGTRAIKIFMGMGFAAVAVLCILIGALDTMRRRRATREEALIL